MKKVLMALVALGMGVSATAQVQVKGYTKRDGTYVAPHMRSSPNSTALDNYSTRGNVNPYTGRVGTKDVYGVSPNNGYGSQAPVPKPYSWQDPE